MTGQDLTEAMLWLAQGERRLSRRDLAERSGVGYNTIGEWSRGESSPALDNFIAVSNAAGYSLPEIWMQAERLAESRRRTADLENAVKRALADED